MRRAIGIVVTLLSLAAPARAQAPATSFADLQSRLKVGETVLVTQGTGGIFKGKVERVTDASLLLRNRGRDLQLAAPTVLRVARPVHTLRNGTLIGLVAGFTAGAVWAGSTECGIVCFSSPAGVLAFGGLFGAIGMGGGAIVGASIHREHVVFERAATGRVQAAVAPFVSRGGTGLRVQLGF